MSQRTRSLRELLADSEKATVTPNGNTLSICVPPDLRDELDIERGDEVALLPEDGELRVIPLGRTD